MALKTRQHSIRMRITRLRNARVSLATTRCWCRWGRWVGWIGPQMKKFEQVLKSVLMNSSFSKTNNIAVKYG